MEEQEVFRGYTVKVKPTFGRPNTYDVVFDRKGDCQNLRGSGNEPEPIPSYTTVKVRVLENGMEARMIKRHPKDSRISDEAFKEKAKNKVKEVNS